MPDYSELKVIHQETQRKALQFFKEKAIGDDLEALSANVIEEIKKEFTLIKRRCMIEMRKRCEASVKTDVDEVRMLIKTGRLESEADLSN